MRYVADTTYQGGAAAGRTKNTGGAGARKRAPAPPVICRIGYVSHVLHVSHVSHVSHVAHVSHVSHASCVLMIWVDF